MKRVCSGCGIPFDDITQRFIGNHGKWWCYGPATYAKEVAEAPEEQAMLDERERIRERVAAEYNAKLKELEKTAPDFFRGRV